MSNLQPTPVTDKNGRQTTVHKRTAPQTSDKRITGLGSTPPVFYDDPNDTASDVFDRMSNGVKSLAGLVATYAEEENYGELARISGKMNALAETVDTWVKVSVKSKSLAEAKGKMITDLKAKVDALAPSQSAERSGYKLAIDYLRTAEPANIEAIASRN